MPSPLRNQRRHHEPRCRFLEELGRLGYQRIIGIDEVGRGALAGPIVVVAVEIYQRIIGINDSKQICAKRRENLSNQITRAAKQVGFGQASNEDIDEFGLNAALESAYQQCLEGMGFDLVLTDHVHLAGAHRFISAIRGDSLFYPTAAASIVAKVYRDQLMSVYHQFHPHFNWRKNAGYGTLEHKKALDSVGPSPLHRQSYLHRP